MTAGLAPDAPVLFLSRFCRHRRAHARRGTAGAAVSRATLERPAGRGVRACGGGVPRSSRSHTAHARGGDVHVGRSWVVVGRWGMSMWPCAHFRVVLAFAFLGMTIAMIMPLASYTFKRSLSHVRH